MDRREFITKIGSAGAAAAIMCQTSLEARSISGENVVETDGSPFTISLSQWAYHRAIFGDARADYNWFIKTLHSDPDSVLLGGMDPRDIVDRARHLGVGVVDPVNILWFGHGRDKSWLKEFKQRANDQEVGFGVFMLDETGNLGSSRKAERDEAIEKHLYWMETAAELGCRYVRVNPYGDGTYLEQCKQCSDSLHRLGELSLNFDHEILVENHGHPGGVAAWLAMLIEMTDHDRVGLFTDFDNFFMGGWGIVPERRYDRIQGMIDLAPYTRAISAKSFDFDESGEETKIDFKQCIQIAKEAGFNGLVSAEYEGEHLSEEAGTDSTIQLLRKVQRDLA